MWFREFQIILECDDYVNPKFPEDESGLVEITALAQFAGDELDSIKIIQVWSLDEDKEIILSDKDKQTAMRYLEARALDRQWEWASVHALEEGEYYSDRLEGL
jgi:hypothetical protein